VSLDEAGERGLDDVGEMRFGQAAAEGGEGRVVKITSPARRRRTRRTRRSGGPSVPGRTVRLNGRLVGEHHRDIVPDRIDAVTADALQALPVGRDFDFGLADGQARMSRSSGSMAMLVSTLILAEKEEGDKPEVCPVRLR